MNKGVNEGQEDTTQKSNKTFSVFLVIIIIILILIIFWLLMSWKDNNSRDLNGDGDIFDIGCNCPQKTPTPEPTTEPDDSNNQGSNSINTPGGSNNGTIINDGNGNDNGSDDNTNPGEGDTGDDFKPADPDDLIISDTDTVWSSTNKLKIFKNPLYNMEEIIAPGSSNSYKFKIKNNGHCSLVYQLNFVEDNKHKINMKYRLNKNGKYLNENWVSYERLVTTEFSLDYRETDNYILEWKWFESDNDTSIGAAMDSSYRLDVEIIGKQRI